LRPKIIRNLLKARILDVAVHHLGVSLREHIASGRMREADALAIEIVRSGIALSPKTSEFAGAGATFQLVIKGLGERTPIDGLDITPEPPRVLSAHEAESHARREPERSWRDAARAAGESVSAEGPPPKSAPCGDDGRRDPGAEPLRSPDGSLINLSAPTRTIFPFGTGIP
jgi:hypothetical protein